MPAATFSLPPGLQASLDARSCSRTHSAPPLADKLTAAHGRRAARLAAARGKAKGHAEAVEHAVKETKLHRSEGAARLRQAVEHDMLAAEKRRQQLLDETRKKCGGHVERARHVAESQRAAAAEEAARKRTAAELVMANAAARRAAKEPRREEATPEAEPIDAAVGLMVDEIVATAYSATALEQRLQKAEQSKIVKLEAQAARCRAHCQKVAAAVETMQTSPPRGRAGSCPRSLATDQARAEENRNKIRSARLARLADHAALVKERARAATAAASQPNTEQAAVLAARLTASETRRNEAARARAVHRRALRSQAKAAGLCIVVPTSPGRQLFEVCEDLPLPSPEPDTPTLLAAAVAGAAGQPAPEQQPAATAAAKKIQGAYWRHRERQAFGRAARSFGRAMAAAGCDGTSSAGVELHGLFDELSELIQAPALVAKAAALLGTAALATAGQPIMTGAKTTVRSPSAKTSRTFLSAFLVAAHPLTVFAELETPDPAHTALEKHLLDAAETVAAAAADLKTYERTAAAGQLGLHAVLHKAVLRAGPEMDSAKLGVVGPGGRVTVAEVLTNPDGKTRARLRGTGPRSAFSPEAGGWASVENGGGGVLLEKVHGRNGLVPLAKSLQAAVAAFESAFEAWARRDTTRLLEESVGIVLEMEKMALYFDAGAAPDVAAERAELERSVALLGGPAAEALLAEQIAALQLHYAPRSPAEAGSVLLPAAAAAAALGRPPAAGQSAKDVNAQLANELLLSPGKFFPGLTAPAAAATGQAAPPAATRSGPLVAVERTVVKAAHAAFWAQLSEELAVSRFGMLHGLLAELATALELLRPGDERWKKVVVGRLDLELLRQQMEHQAFGPTELEELVEWAAGAVMLAGPPANDTAVGEWAATATAALVAAFQVAGLQGLAVELPAVFEWLWDAVEEIAQAVHRHQLAPHLAEVRAAAPGYLRRHFTQRHPDPSPAGLPKTAAWLRDAAGVGRSEHPAVGVSTVMQRGLAALISAGGPDAAGEQLAPEHLPEVCELIADRLAALQLRLRRAAAAAAIALLAQQPLRQLAVPLPAVAVSELVDGQETDAAGPPPRRPSVKTSAASAAPDPLAAVQLRSGLQVAPPRGTAADEADPTPPSLAELADAALEALNWAAPGAPPPSEAHRKHDAVQVAAVLGARITEACDEHGGEWDSAAASSLTRLVESVLSGGNAVAATLHKRLGQLAAVAPLPARPAALGATLSAKGLRGMQPVAVDVLARVAQLVDHMEAVHGERLALLLPGATL